MAEPMSPATLMGSLAAEPARAPRGVDRLAAAMRDLSLDPVARPSEQERALMLSLLTGLVGHIAEELLLRLPDMGQSEIDVGLLVDRLREAGMISRAELVGLLIRRADIIAFRMSARSPGGNGLLEGWAADAETAIVEAAMAVVIARASAKDRFGRPGLTLADCDAELAVSLTYAVAAALPCSPEFLVAAAIDLLARHDEGERLEAQEARLMRALEQGGRLDGNLLLSLAAQGEMGLLAEGLARLARIPSNEAWQALTGRNDPAVGRLLRVAEVERAQAAGLIAILSDGRGLRDPAEAMAAFDAMTATDASDERARVRLPAAFLKARSALEGYGQRSA